MLRTTCALLLLLSGLGRAECDQQVSRTLTSLHEVPVADRPTVVLGSIARDCEAALSKPLAINWKELLITSPEFRAITLGNTSGSREARADFEAACPGWSKSKLAKEFLGRHPVTEDAFKLCHFERFAVVTAAEFASAEVRHATSALVLFVALVKAGVNADLAKKAARVVVLPTEAGPE